MSALKLLILLSLIGGLSACAGRAPVPPPLELRAWDAPGRPKAVILALHSFGDYSAAFDLAAPDLAAAGYQVYGFDQAGFGARTLADGRWAGEARLVADAADTAPPNSEPAPGIKHNQTNASNVSSNTAAAAHSRLLQPQRDAQRSAAARPRAPTGDRTPHRTGAPSCRA